MLKQTGLLSLTVALMLAFGAPAPVHALEKDLAQAAAFSMEENAENYAEMLRTEGKNAFVRVKIVDGKTFYAVMVDSNRAGANKPAPDMAKTPAAAPAATKPQAMKPSAAMQQNDLPAEVQELHVEDDVLSSKAQLKNVPPPPDEAMPQEPKPQKTLPSNTIKETAPAGGTSVVTLEPVKGNASQTIVITEDTPIYDRPFETGKVIGTYKSLGGALFMREYMGWYAIKLKADERHVFIRKSDARLTAR